MENTSVFKKRTGDLILHGANNGHVGDMYTMYEWYKEGKFSVEKDELLAVEYRRKAFECLVSNQLYYSKISINGFKGIKSTLHTIDLNERLNLFVGVNGCGKTTILESIAKSYSWIINQIKSASIGRSIKEFQINNSSEIQDCFLEFDINVGARSKFEMVLAKSKVSDGKRAKSYLEEFRRLGTIFADFNNTKDNLNLPIFAYYSTGRAVDVNYESSKIDIESISSSSKFDAYSNVKGEQGSYKDIIKWLAVSGTLEDDNKKLLRKQLNKLNGHAVKLAGLLSKLPTHLLDDVDLVSSMKESRKETEEYIVKLESELFDGNEISELIKFVISKFMGIDNIRTEVNEEYIEVKFEKDGVTLNASDLSHGEKSLFLLVTDIARRLYLLNPGRRLNNVADVLDGNGVVLIDEIEVHLHPKWQQIVIPRLVETFKNIQFIITTHSPQVVATVKEECIKVISNDKGDLSFSRPDFSYGSESNSVMEDIFGAQTRSTELEIIKKLNQFKELIMNGDWDSQTYRELEEELTSWAGHHDPVVKKMQMDVVLRKRRKSSGK
ncbi:AAA family ATPase [Shewanella algae]|uniref:AAA family ATPase n=1 Tax=Shewanella algae TaxID=38313 RepID=UPI0031F584E3